MRTIALDQRVVPLRVAEQHEIFSEQPDGPDRTRPLGVRRPRPPAANTCARACQPASPVRFSSSAHSVWYLSLGLLSGSAAELFRLKARVVAPRRSSPGEILAYLRYYAQIPKARQ